MAKIEREENNPQKNTSFLKSLPKPQRTAFLFLSVVSLGIIILWLWQVNSRIISPFQLPGGQQATSTNLSNVASSLYNIDTDGDGLTDQEEINLYHTSPYLEDTDGDGISDFQEVQNGTDPNCPQGQTCNGTGSVVASSTNSNVNSILPAIGSSTSTSSTASTSDATLQQMMSGQADASQLRALLLKNGVDSNILSQLSDQELLSTYQQMLQEQSASSTSQ